MHIAIGHATVPTRARSDMLQAANYHLQLSCMPYRYMLTNAFRHFEPKIELLVVNAPPCGHCRQFLNELPHADEMMVSFPEEGEGL